VLEMKRHIYGLANTMRLVDRAKYVAKLFWHIYIYIVTSMTIALFASHCCWEKGKRRRKKRRLINDLQKSKDDGSRCAEPISA
jgi:hypothetical protein